ncbi:F-box domain-containing protein [Mycena venus]|uniref:F-box domain-containing protein n=1 Tax=Mycena venus TaxID=2733690 RepID=A0A8H6XNN7_9AGAR|nr:F-box domain-containing protein [Mycena venus]
MTYMNLQVDRTRLSDIEVQILDLERSLSALRAEKEVVRERLDSYRYPVLTLPNEIVSEIFVQFLPLYPDPPPFCGDGSPTTLTHICHKWREVALATPLLWRALAFSPYDTISVERQRYISEIWLKRSYSCPLSIIIDNWWNIYEFPSELVPHCARWEHLKLTGSNLPKIDGPMPLLRDLGIMIGLCDLFPSYDAPLLRTVFLNTVAASRITLPWKQLASLTLYWVQSSQCVAILQQTVDLVHCDLDFPIARERIHTGPDITLPYLDSLVLKNSNGGSLIGFLDTLVVPALRILHLPERFLGATPIESLKSFISKSGCTLEQVHLTGVRTLLATDKSYHSAFPHIPDFTFQVPYIEETPTDDEDVEDGDNSG